MAKREPTATVQLKVRLREDLRALLEGAAKEKEVSLNQEIVDRLKWALSARVVEANQNLVLAEISLLSLKLDEISVKLEKAELAIAELRELEEGGYSELTNEIEHLRRAVARGYLDEDDNK